MPARSMAPTKLARHTAWYGAAGALGKASALLAVPFLTRQLDPQGYGLTDLATSLAGLLIVLVSFAADIPAMRIAASEPRLRPQTYAAYVLGTIAVSFLGMLLLLPASGFVTDVLWATPGQWSVAAMSLVLVPFSAIQFALLNILRFVERPRMYALLAAVDLFAQLALAVAFVSFGWGALGAVTGYVVGSVIGMVAAALAAWPYLARQIDIRAIGRLLMEGLPFVPGAAAFIAADGIARMVAANFLSVAAVGQLALAIRIASVLSLSSLAFQMAWGPYGLALTPGRDARDIFRRVALALIAVICIASLGLGSLAPEIAVIIGGEEFAAAGTVVPGLLISAGLPAVLYVLGTAAGILRRGRWVAWSTLLGAATQVIGTTLLLPPLGLAGFAVGAILGRVVSLLVLGRGVTETAPLPWSGFALLAGATAMVLWLQTLNADAAATLPTRLAVAGIAALVGMVVMSRVARQVLRSRPTSS